MFGYDKQKLVKINQKECKCLLLIYPSIYTSKSALCHDRLFSYLSNLQQLTTGNSNERNAKLLKSQLPNQSSCVCPQPGQQLFP